jgi:hypothetical protein
MSKLPKLKIKIPFGYPNEDICDLEQARYRFNFSSGTVILVEGQAVKSYEQLVQIATGDDYKDREYLEAVLITDLASGG